MLRINEIERLEKIYTAHNVPDILAHHGPLRMLFVKAASVQDSRARLDAFPIREKIHAQRYVAVLCPKQAGLMTFRAATGGIAGPPAGKSNGIVLSGTIRRAIDADHRGSPFSFGAIRHHEPRGDPVVCF